VKRLLVLSITLFLAMSGTPARADCNTSTAGTKPAGFMFYNSDQKILQYCDGTNWIAMHAPGSGSGGCNTATAGAKTEGAMFYNTGSRVLQGCAGNVWQAMGPVGGSSGGWEQISSGGSHTCALRTDGTIWCWGGDTFGQLGNGAGLTDNQHVPIQESTAATDWVMVNAGDQHTCAVKTNGTLWCWGSANDGRLGNGAAFGNQETPSQESTAATNWAAVEAGNRHTCAIKTNGTLWCWGLDNWGQLGNGADGAQTSPDQESTAATDWATVSGGQEFTCATKTNGTLWCWGVDSFGKLGNGADGNQISPDQESTAATDWTKVDAGDNHACATKTNGTLWCWGWDSSGQLGNGADGNQISPDQESTSATDWAAVWTANNHTCATKTNGTLWCWGPDTNGELGNGADGSQISPDQESTSATDWKAMTGGSSHSCAVKTNGTVWCWGANFAGQLGNSGRTGLSLSPVQEGTTAANWKETATGRDHSCAVKTDGTLWCWGRDNSLQLGDGAGSTNQPTPVQEATAATDWKTVTAGLFHTCATKTNNTLWCWGEDGDGQLGNGAVTGQQHTPSQESTAATDWAVVDAGGQHTCAVKANGTLWCWGFDGNQELGNSWGVSGDQISPYQEFTAATDWSTVSAGVWYTCAVKTTGTLWCWGDDVNDQLGNGATSGQQDVPVQEATVATDWKTVAAGEWHTCAIKTNGTLWCWGLDGDGQIGDGLPVGNIMDTPVQEATGATDWATVVVGQEHTCATKTNSSLWCWGNDRGGQLGNAALDGAQHTPVQEPTVAKDWTSVAAGEIYTCAVKNGTLLCWGENQYGEIGSVTATLADSPLRNTECVNPLYNEGMLLYNSASNVMQYCDGANWVAIGKGPSDPCAGSPSIGADCADGTVYAGLSPDGNVPMYTTSADAGTFTWNNGNMSNNTTTSQTSNTTGEANTNNLITLDSDSGTGGTQPHQAAQYCADLTAGGHSDWYLPARNELNVLYTNRVAIGGFELAGGEYGPPAPSWYWSSTETSFDNIWLQRFEDGSTATWNKYHGKSVRCVRK